MSDLIQTLASGRFRATTPPTSSGAVIQETFDCEASYLTEAMQSRTRIDLAPRCQAGHPNAGETVIFQIRRCWQHNPANPAEVRRERFVLVGYWAGKRLPLLVRAAGR